MVDFKEIKRITFKRALESLVLILAALLIMYSFCIYNLSKPIADPVVQNFYEALAEGDGLLPLYLKQKLTPMISDGMSTTDYLDFSEAIRVHCGQSAQSLLERSLLNFNLGMLDLFTFGTVSLHTEMVITNGRSLVQQLDSTLCGA